MPLRRVYLALSPLAVAGLASAREIGPAPLAAFAVTSAMAGRGGSLEDEQLEHEAWLAAAEAARPLSGGRARRVIAAADVDDALVRELAGAAAGRVEIDAPVPLRRIVSFHVDEEVGGTEPTDLLWYDVTELADVLALTQPS